MKDLFQRVEDTCISPYRQNIAGSSKTTPPNFGSVWPSGELPRSCSPTRSTCSTPLRPGAGGRSTTHFGRKDFSKSAKMGWGTIMLSISRRPRLRSCSLITRMANGRRSPRRSTIGDRHFWEETRQGVPGIQRKTPEKRRPAYGNPQSPITDKVLKIAFEKGAATGTQAGAIARFLREASTKFPDVKIVLQFIP
jgi:hypothetical protein